MINLKYYWLKPSNLFFLRDDKGVGQGAHRRGQNYYVVLLRHLCLRMVSHHYFTLLLFSVQLLFQEGRILRQTLSELVQFVENVEGPGKALVVVYCLQTLPLDSLLDGIVHGVDFFAVIGHKLRRKLF